MDRPSGLPVEHGRNPGASPPSRGARWRGPALVVLAMVVAFGVGVLVATRTDLFPPQVQGALARGPASPGDHSVTQSGSLRWRGAMTSSTSQRYSAGSCVTVWRSSMRIVTEVDGLVRGRGRSRLEGDPNCPFPMSQPQIRGYAFDVGGRLDPERGFLISLERVEPTKGIFEYGGFASIAAPGSVLEAQLAGSDRAMGRSVFRTRTSLGKVISSRTTVRLRCQDCSAA
jgi:hypothetical protein